jgi:hypothetical protein
LLEALVVVVVPVKFVVAVALAVFYQQLQH